MQIPEERIYQFGQFRLDARRYRLYQNGEQIQLTPKTCEILLLLVERAGVLVEKDQIWKIIWPDQIIDESNLSQHIYKLRKVLGDNKKSQDYILTIPGRGYIFSCNVQILNDWMEIESRNNSSDGPIPVTTSSSLTGDDVSEQPGGLSESSVQQHRRGIKRRSVVLITATASLIIVVTALIVFRSRTAQSPASTLPQIVPLVTLPGEETDPAFSPDGRYLAFTSEGETEDNQDIYVRMIDQDVMWQVTSHPDNDKQPTWSPDGTRLAFLRTSDQYAKKHKLIVIPVRGGVEQEIGEVWAGLSWSPDGKYLAVLEDNDSGTTTRLSLLSVDGQERKVLNPTPSDVYDTNQQFSPDGQMIAFVRRKNNTNSDLFLFTIATGELKQLTFDERVISDFQWDLNSNGLYFISNRKDQRQLWRIQVSGGEPTPMPLSLPNLNSIAISPDGELLACTQPITDTQIDIFRINGGELNPLRPFCKINSSRADDTPRFSPDGSRIAFVSFRSKYDEIWIANADCSNPFQLTRFNQQGVGSPRWSPDGQQIVFDRNFKDNTDIFVIRANGTDIRQLTSDRTVQDLPSWSWDGQWIYFSSYKTSVSRIYRMPSGGGEAVPVTNSPGREPIESADGKTLYYTNGDRLWRKDLSTGKEGVIPQLSEVVIGRYWDIVGTTLFYVSPPQSGGRPQVMTFDLENRQSSQLFELPGSLARWVPGIAFTPRDNLLAIGYVSNRHGDIHLIKGWR